MGGRECIIQIADGTYDENVRVADFNNGHLTIRRMGTYTTASILCNVTGMICARSTAIINIVGLNFTRSNDHGFFGRACTGLLVQLCMSRTASADYAGFYFSDMSRVRMVNCRVTNRKWGVIASVLTDLVSENWETDSINTDNGIASTNGAIVHLIGNQPTAVWQFYAAAGGQFIQENGTQISGLITSGISCTWGTVQGGYVRHGNQNGISMITLQFQVTITTALSANTVYTINGFPAPSGPVAVAVPVHQPGVINWAQINNGTNTVSIRTPVGSTLAVGITINFNATYLTNS